MSVISKPILNEEYLNYIYTNVFIDCPMFNNVQFNMNGDIKINGKIKKYKPQNPLEYYRVLINNSRYVIHRLMAVTWFDINYDDDCVVDHFDHNRHNNNIDNLRISNNSVNASNTTTATLVNSNPINLIDLNEFGKDLYYDKSTNQFVVKLYDDLYKQINVLIKTHKKTNVQYKSIKYNQNGVRYQISYRKLMKYVERFLN